MTFPFSSASVDLSFSTGQYFDSSVGTILPTSVLSITRASSGYAKASAGTLTSFGSNVLRITDLGLLAEDARTNVITNSQAFSAASWNAFSTLVATDNVTTAPDGTTTAAKLVGNNGVTEPVLSAGASASGAVTWSCYFKAAEFGFATLGAIATTTTNRYSIVVNLATGAITATNTAGTPSSPTATTEVLGNGWVRATISLSAGGSANIQIAPCDRATPTWQAADNMPNNVGSDGTSGIYAWGAQVEAGSFVSSYIVTTTAAATRAADGITTAGSLSSVLTGSAASLVGSVEVDMPSPASFADLTAGATGFARASLNLAFGGATHLASIMLETSNNFVLQGDSGIVNFSGINARAGFSWDAGGRSTVCNGATVSTDAHAPQGFAGNPNVGSGGYGALYGYLRRLTVWSFRLPDATLQALTGGDILMPQILM